MRISGIFCFLNNRNINGQSRFRRNLNLKDWYSIVSIYYLATGFHVDIWGFKFWQVKELHKNFKNLNMLLSFSGVPARDDP